MRVLLNCLPLFATVRSPRQTIVNNAGGIASAIILLLSTSEFINLVTVFVYLLIIMSISTLSSFKHSNYYVVIDIFIDLNKLSLKSREEII